MELTKNTKSFGKLCFKGQLHADSFLVELIFILLSHISQGDFCNFWKGLYAIICFKFKTFQLNHTKLIA